MIRNVLCTLLGLWVMTLGSVLAASIDGKSKNLTSVDDVLQKMAEALGGRDRLARVSNSRLRLTIEAANLKGPSDLVTCADGSRRQSVNLGNLGEQLTVFDGKQGWIRDPNGKVRPMAGPEIEDEISVGYLENWLYLKSGKLAGRVELVGEDQETKAFIVRVHPEGAQPATLYVDKQTYLPIKIEQPSRDRTSTIYLEDWRVVDGVKIAFRFRQSTGDAKYDAVSTVESVEFNVAVDPTAFAQPADGAKDYAFANGSSATGIPFELTANHIYLQVRVNGSEPLWFLFDTGAAATVINRSRADALGLKMQGSVEARGSGSGSLEAAFVPGVTLSVPGVEVVNQTIVAIPLDGLSPFEGRQIDGIVGYDFTSRVVVEIDYTHNVINFHEPKTYAYKGKGERLQIALEGNIPRVKARMDYPGHEPLEGWFTIDTGSRNALMIHSPTVKSTEWLGQIAQSAVKAPHGIGVGGIAKTTIGRLSALHLGGFEVRNLVVGYSFDEKGANAAPDLAGNIGDEVLRRFFVVFDYSRHEMILEPNGDLGAPFEYDMFGALLMADGTEAKGFRVVRVIEGTAAKDSGVVEGDVIVAIDGKPTSSIPLEKAKTLFRENGREVHLTIQRESEKRDVKVTLRRIV